MGKEKAWLLLAAVTLTVLIAGAGLGRQVLSVPTTSVVSASPATQCKAPNIVSCFDTSGHKVSFVTVEPDVQLEVLDWGGTGETLVLLAGFGNNAHMYDHFAYQFTDKFHVIGITRRGFGCSSQPASGYDVDTRARDTIRVLDALNIPAGLFAGHSLAGEELSKLGAVYPDRVKKLVYMDAYEYGKHASLRELPSPQFTDADLTSIEHFAAIYVRYNGFRAPNAAACHSFKLDAEGKILDSVTPEEISKQVRANAKQAEYERIQAPALGIFYVWTRQTILPGYRDLDTAQQAEFDQLFPSYVEWQADAIQRFRTLIKKSRVVELDHSNHYVFLTDEATVVREMRKFLLEE